ncbi:killer cell lectin-like receptor subfamily B member 1B allele C isoform 1-T3 [Morus bassanus]
MAGEIIYADLDIGPGKRCRKQHSLPQPGTSGCPRWYRTALWASGTGNLALGVAVVVTGYLLLRQPLENPGSCKNESRNVGDGNATLENVCLKLRKDLCLSKLQGGEGCKLCPMGWMLRGTKCYWVASGVNPWSESKQDCVNQNAELVMPGDQDELDFIKEMVKKPRQYFWIGLSVPSAGKGWTWLNGSCLDQSRFLLSSWNESRLRRSCGVFKEGTISSESCSSGLQWICQKEATQL